MFHPEKKQLFWILRSQICFFFEKFDFLFEKNQFQQNIFIILHIFKVIWTVKRFPTKFLIKNTWLNDLDEFVVRKLFFTILQLFVT